MEILIGFIAFCAVACAVAYLMDKVEDYLKDNGKERYTK